MTALTFGTFIHLSSSQETTKQSIEAALSVPEGFWAFKYDRIKSLIYVTWNPSGLSKRSNGNVSTYRLRLWSGQDPQKMALTGQEEVVVFKLNDLPWERPVPTMALGPCFWFGIEESEADQNTDAATSSQTTDSSDSSSQQKWVDLLREIERTILTCRRVSTESMKWKAVTERLAKELSSKKIVQSEIAQGEMADSLRKEMKTLQKSIENVREFVGQGVREPNKFEMQRLRIQKLILIRDELRHQMNKLEKELESKDTDIVELSETVYRLQCENEILSGEADIDNDNSTRDSNVLTEKAFEDIPEYDDSPSSSPAPPELLYPQTGAKIFQTPGVTSSVDVTGVMQDWRALLSGLI